MEQLQLTLQFTVTVDCEAIANYLDVTREINEEDAISVLAGAAISNWQYDNLVDNQAITFVKAS